MAPPGSATSWKRSHSRRCAARIASSVTRTAWLTNRWAIGNISAPTCLAPKLSAASPPTGAAIGSPARNASCRAGQASGSTLMIRALVCVPGGDSADQTAATGSHQDVGQVGRILLELPSQGALARQHGFVVVGVDLQRAGFGLAVAGGDQSLGVGVAAPDHAGAVTGDAGELSRRRVRWGRRFPRSRPGCGRHRATAAP